MPVKPEILFLFPNHATGHFSHCLGTAYIIAYLQQEGVSAEQFYNYKLLTIPQITDKILSFETNIVGFTCYHTNYFLIKTLCRHLKKRKPGIFIIAGGPTPTFSDRAVLHNVPEIDICVRGEGEFTTREIIEHLKRNRIFSSIQGITYRLNNRVIRAPDRPLAQLDALPSPYINNILNPADIINHGEEIPVITSRGCIFKCTYCNCAAISKHTIRYHSPERVAAELEIIHNALKGKQARAIRIYDDCFTLSNNRTEQICNYIIKKNLNLNIAVSTRADYVNEKILRLLYKSGVKNISFGIESVNPKTLFRVKKIRLFYKKIDRFRPEKRFLDKLKLAVALAKRIGFETEASIILGLPGEGVKDILRTINFVKRLGLRLCYCNYLGIYPGTELFRAFKGDKLKASEKWLRIPWHKLFNIPILTNSNIAAKKRINTFLCNAFLMGFLNIRSFAHSLLFTDNNAPFLNELQDITPVQSILFLAQYTGRHTVQGNRKIKIRHTRLGKILGLGYQNNRIDYNMLKNYYPYHEVHSYWLNQFKFSDIFLNKGSTSRNIILDISSAARMAEFEKLLLNMPELAGRIFSNKISQFTLVDACRWSRSCPAKNLSRLIVDKKLRISTCFHGKIIGKLGEPVEKIKKRCAGYIQSERKKRGCEKCPVKDYCSQCPFLGGIYPETFCRIKREYSARIDKFIALMNLKNAVNLPPG
ncbi:MAG: radical SAM protein [Candidatus Omnitrophota bacterium]